MAELNPRLAELQDYPFTRLARLLGNVAPGEKPLLRLTIGEPQHAAPEFVGRVIADHLDGLSRYPATAGTSDLKQAIADWATSRYRLRAGVLDPDTMVLPVNGSREALFSFAQVALTGDSGQLMCMPNPFYQIYEGAALLAGAQPYFLNCTAGNGYQTDVDRVPDSVWERCQLLYLCSPANPTGATLELSDYQRIIELADRFDFIVASDECYSELYLDEAHPPAGLLQACAALGRDDFRNCLVFHSLSKRSNLPGLRSGFVAGDPKLLAPYLLYRTYHGSAMSELVQAVSVAAWRDEEHVVSNRALYRDKFAAVIPLLSEVMDVATPGGGFYLWPDVGGDELEFTRDLYREQSVMVMPGTFMTRSTPGGDPGRHRIRIALVTPLEECLEATHRIVDFCRRRRIAG